MIRELGHTGAAVARLSAVATDCADVAETNRAVAATIGAAALAASSGKLARRAASVGTAPALGLGAYAAWCAFATALSAKVAALNPDDPD